MSSKSVADELRQAAQRIQDLAEAATAGPWRADGTEIYGLEHLGHWVGETLEADDGADGKRNAAHIALWNPEVAILVAHWLDIARERWESDPLAVSEEECDEIYHPAIAIARAINGSK